jgi:phage terminase large subunit-like protein
MMPDSTTSQITWAELIDLCAVDNELFCKTFFPATFRDDFPDYFNRIWDGLETRESRFVNMQIFRGGAKTTNLRAFAAKRIAYGISRTIMVIGASQDKAEKTVRWLKNAIKKNRRYAGTFQLSPGSKWTETEIEIVHGIYNHTVAVVAYGIMGNVRGINIDDYRPDLILIDDANKDETVATAEQRDKIENLVLGAVKNTLAPESEAPDGKLVILQTPMHNEDITMKAMLDPTYITVRQPCWTLETENLPVEFRRSSWERRFSTDGLVKDRIGHIRRNKLSIFSREMECKVTAAESASFERSWLRFWDPSTLPPLANMYVVVSVDPVPPPSKGAIEQGLVKKDFECISAVGYYRGDYYLLEYQLNRGHDPTWTIATLFDLAQRWRAKSLVVETVAYQQTLAWLIGVAMQRQRYHLPIIEVKDRRSKLDKINEAYKLICPFGNFFVNLGMSEFLSCFESYPEVSHDDVLDAPAMAITHLTTLALADSAEAFDDDDFPMLTCVRRAP